MRQILCKKCGTELGTVQKIPAGCYTDGCYIGFNFITNWNEENVGLNLSSNRNVTCKECGYSYILEKDSIGYPVLRRPYRDF